MTLAAAVAGATRPSQTITWTRLDGNVEPLTDASLTGKIRDRSTGETRSITGSLTVIDGTEGVFRWDYSLEDVEKAGSFNVQFEADFLEGQTPAKTFSSEWTVERSL